MTSFLPFAWGRNSSHHDQHDHDIPGVTFSSSGDTASVVPNEDVGGGTAGKTNLQTPQTPEGLRPRRSVEAIRKEWNMCSAHMDRFDCQCPSPRRELSLCVVPPRSIQHQAPPDPLSPPNFGHAISPQISTSTFYSSSSAPGRGVAMSPHLKVGQARTAVGALVAMAEAARPDLDSAKMSMSVPSSDPTSNNDLGVLPPRTWIEQDAYDDHESVGSNLSYRELNESTNQLISGKKRKERVAASPSSTEDESTQHASPSSNNYRRQSIKDAKQSDYNALDSSFGWLMSEPPHAGPTYDFDPIVNQDLFVDQAPDDDVDVSAISHSTKSKDSEHSFDEEDEELSYHYQYMKPEEDEMADVARRQRIKLQRQLKENTLVAMVARLQDNETLVRDTLESLQQSTGYLRRMTPMEKESIINGFSKETRNLICRNIDAILTEMTVAIPEDFFLSPTQVPKVAETHDDLEHALSFCRTLVGKSIPDKENQESMKRTGTTPEDIHRWKCLPGFRSCLGFEEMPESPDTVRGGDTSLFSLPSESANTTPHTSNVSVTTTITSAISSPARNLRPMGGRNVDGVRLRRTLEAAATLLDRLSKACTKLQMASNASNEASILAAEEVKRVYLQLLAIKTDDLNSLIDSFELDIPPMQITRLVSDDCGDAMESAPYLGYRGGPVSSSLRMPRQPSSHQMPRDSGGIFNSIYASERVNQEQSWGQVNNLFSPSTNDMNSLDNTTYVQDDLRRTAGSFDRDETNVNNNGQRDGPPQGTYMEYSEQQQQQQQNVQKKKHRRGRHRGSKHLKLQEAAE